MATIIWILSLLALSNFLINLFIDRKNLEQSYKVYLKHVLLVTNFIVWLIGVQILFLLYAALTDPLIDSLCKLYELKKYQYKNGIVYLLNGLMIFLTTYLWFKILKWFFQKIYKTEKQQLAFFRILNVQHGVIWFVLLLILFLFEIGYLSLK